MNALEIRGLDVRYGAIQALHGIDLDVAEGRITTLLGGNGAGKTTLLRTISGLQRARAGTVTLHHDGRREDLTGLEPHTIVRRGVAQSPEGRQVFPNLTVRENLLLGAWTRTDPAGVAADLERAVVIFPRLGERMGQKAGTLSGGEQQMLAIARAMMARPKVLLLDEPSLGLAPVVVADIFATLRDIHAEGVTILLVEQNAHLALSIAHDAYVLETGRIQARAPAAELLADDRIRAAYLGG